MGTFNGPHRLSGMIELHWFEARQHPRGGREAKFNRVGSEGNGSVGNRVGWVRRPSTDYKGRGRVAGWRITGNARTNAGDGDSGRRGVGAQGQEASRRLGAGTGRPDPRGPQMSQDVRSAGESPHG